MVVMITVMVMVGAVQPPFVWQGVLPSGRSGRVACWRVHWTGLHNNGPRAHEPTSRVSSATCHGPRVAAPKARGVGCVGRAPATCMEGSAMNQSERWQRQQRPRGCAAAPAPHAGHLP